MGGQQDTQSLCGARIQRQVPHSWLAVTLHHLLAWRTACVLGMGLGDKPTYLFKILLFKKCIKNKETERNLPSSGSLPQCPKQPGGWSPTQISHMSGSEALSHWWLGTGTSWVPATLAVPDVSIASFVQSPYRQDHHPHLSWKGIGDEKQQGQVPGAPDRPAVSGRTSWSPAREPQGSAD